MLSFDHVIQKPEFKIQIVLHDMCISSQFKKNNVPKKNKRGNLTNIFQLRNCG